MQIKTELASPDVNPLSSVAPFEKHCDVSATAIAETLLQQNFETVTAVACLAGSSFD